MVVDHNGRATQVTAPRDARMAKTRAALHGALLAILEEQPFEQVTIREITVKAGVGYATFFRHYPDKETLLHDFAARQISQLLAMALPLLFTVDSHASTRALCAYVWEHRKLWSALLTGGAAGALKDEFVQQALRVAAQYDGGVDTGLPNELRVVFCVTGVVEILAWWLKQKAPLSVNRMAEVLDRLVVAPSIQPV
jgi:AcrR family transcriptional regulator